MECLAGLDVSLRSCDPWIASTHGKVVLEGDLPEEFSEIRARAYSHICRQPASTQADRQISDIRFIASPHAAKKNAS